MKKMSAVHTAVRSRSAPTGRYLACQLIEVKTAEQGALPADYLLGWLQMGPREVKGARVLLGTAVTLVVLMLQDRVQV
jgi:hypothetical protein